MRALVRRKQLEKDLEDELAVGAISFAFVILPDSIVAFFLPIVDIDKQRRETEEVM